MKKIKLTIGLVYRDSSGRLKRTRNLMSDLQSRYHAQAKLRRNVSEIESADKNYGLLRTRIHSYVMLVHMSVVLYLSFTSRNS